jgi:uncharacterized protein YprB with RNaseH-like and TPR domain
LAHSRRNAFSSRKRLLMTIKRKSDTPRTVCFDIESTDLKVPFGSTLCCSFISLEDKKVVTFRIDDPKYKGEVPEDDSKLVKAIKEYLEGSFCWIGWYSKMFDIPFLNARLTLHGIPPIEKRMHLDLLYYARPPFAKFYSSKLDAVAKTLDLPVQKTELDPQTWVAARRLDKKAMDYVVKHCEHDVLVLREVFKTLSPFVKNIHV